MQNIHILTGFSVAELKHREQKEVGGKNLFKLIAYMSITGELEQKPWRDAAIQIAFSDLLNLLSYTTQDYLLMDGTIHNGLAPPIPSLIINQDDSPEIYIQSNSEESVLV